MAPRFSRTRGLFRTLASLSPQLHTGGPSRPQNGSTRYAPHAVQIAFVLRDPLLFARPKSPFTQEQLVFPTSPNIFFFSQLRFTPIPSVRRPARLQVLFLSSTLGFLPSGGTKQLAFILPSAVSPSKGLYASFTIRCGFQNLIDSPVRLSRFGHFVRNQVGIYALPFFFFFFCYFSFLLMLFIHFVDLVHMFPHWCFNLAHIPPPRV